MSEPVAHAAPMAPQPFSAPVRRPVNRWNVASLLTLIGGHILVVVGGLVFAAVLIFSNPVTGDQAGWNVLAFILLPIGALNAGYGGIFAVVALVFAVVGLRKHGRSAFGIVMVIVSALFALKVFSLVEWLQYLPYYLVNGFGSY